MMGIAGVNLDAPITKISSGILIMKDESAYKPEVSPCIRCATCVDVCPQGLEPYLIHTLIRNGEYQEAKKFTCLTVLNAGAVHILVRLAFRCSTIVNWLNTK